jgi:hypothetical protein
MAIGNICGAVDMFDAWYVCVTVCYTVCVTQGVIVCYNVKCFMCIISACGHVLSPSL